MTAKGSWNGNSDAAFGAILRITATVFKEASRKFQIIFPFHKAA
jgi:hypothetical protein